MHFGENQLFPSLISLSLRPTAHPPIFQHWWVRASTKFYQRFTLAMGSSLGFGSADHDLFALFRLAFATATPVGLTLPQSTTRWLIMQKVRGHSEELPLFVSMWFQVLFHSPLGVLFTFPSRYLFTIGQQVVLSLGRWSSQIPPGFHVPEGTQESCWSCSAFAYGGVTLYAVAFQPLLLASHVP